MSKNKAERYQLRILGFTLMEVLLVLLLLGGAGFVLAVKLPVHLQSQRLAQSSTRLLEEIRDARQAAMAENTWYQIRFFYSNNSYRVMKEGKIIKDIVLEDEVLFLNNPPVLMFNAEGIPNTGMTIAIGINAGERRKIIIAPVTGRIREE